VDNSSNLEVVDNRLCSMEEGNSRNLGAVDNSSNLEVVNNRLCRMVEENRLCRMVRGNSRNLELEDIIEIGLVNISVLHNDHPREVHI